MHVFTVPAASTRARCSSRRCCRICSRASTSTFGAARQHDDRSERATAASRRSSTRAEQHRRRPSRRSAAAAAAEAAVRKRRRAGGGSAAAAGATPVSRTTRWPTRSRRAAVRRPARCRRRPATFASSPRRRATRCSSARPTRTGRCVQQVIGRRGSATAAGARSRSRSPRCSGPHDLDVGVSGTSSTRERQDRRATARPPRRRTPARATSFSQLDGRQRHDQLRRRAQRRSQARGDVRVLSLPVIIAQNNRQAMLNVGSSRPFVQVSQTVPNDPTGRVQTVQYIDVGTVLTITPTINPDGYVNLQVSQTDNSATNEVQFDAPVIDKREATTQIFIRDGQTTVIGGLADNTRSTTSLGHSVPQPHSVHRRAAVRQHVEERRRRRELFLFLTPHIISSDDDIDKLRDAVREGQRPAQGREHRSAHHSEGRHAQGDSPDASRRRSHAASRLAQRSRRSACAPDATPAPPPVDRRDAQAADGSMAIAIVPRPNTRRRELLEVERLTTALSADWLEQYGVLPLRLERRRADGRDVARSRRAAGARRSASAVRRAGSRSSGSASTICAPRFVASTRRRRRPPRG